jgi:hypothetical protein
MLVISGSVIPFILKVRHLTLDATIDAKDYLCKSRP